MTIELESDTFYHIYNRANGNEKIFANTGNYNFFLDKYRQHISPIASTFCYCLLPNHFHFLIRIKSKKEIELVQAAQEAIKKSKVSSQGTPPAAFPKFKTLEMLPPTPEKFLSKQFSNFFSSYTQAFNKQQNRMGSLFMKNFKRKPVQTERYLKNLVHYIHLNPVEAWLCSSPEGWKYSSYNSIINPSPSENFICRDEVQEWFGDRENFIHFHQQSPQLTE